MMTTAGRPDGTGDPPDCGGTVVTIGRSVTEIGHLLAVGWTDWLAVTRADSLPACTEGYGKVARCSQS